MDNGTKIKIGLDVGIDIGTVIYIFLLSRYNKILYEIQEKYTNVFIQAVHIVEEPNYYGYLIAGAVFVILLIFVSVKSYRAREEIGILGVMIMIVINIILLISLLIVYSNPVFTAFATMSTVAGVGSAASG